MQPNQNAYRIPDPHEINRESSGAQQQGLRVKEHAHLSKNFIKALAHCSDMNLVHAVDSPGPYFSSKSGARMSGSVQTKKPNVSYSIGGNDISVLEISFRDIIDSFLLPCTSRFTVIFPYPAKLIILPKASSCMPACSTFSQFDRFHLHNEAWCSKDE
jgi:hypothetical protein